MSSVISRGLARRLCCAGLCLALCLVLPFLTGQIPNIGGMLCPMHLPVLICGFVCGGELALCVGFAAPLLRYVLLGMPPIFPTGIGMAVELAVYGLVSGAAYASLGKTRKSVYPALISAMLAGRIVWGLVRWTMAVLTGIDFTPYMFISGALLGAVPGIISQLVLVPLVVEALRRMNCCDF